MKYEDEILKQAERVFRMRGLALRVVYLAGALLVLGWIFRSSNAKVATSLLIASGLLLACSLAISLIHWRCPACGGRFQLRHLSQESRMAHCPYCGVKLR